MATEKQIQANRLNAQRSTGPQTSEGKAKVGLNAITHGLRTRSMDVLPNEDPTVYQNHIDAWISHYNPATPVEEQFVRRAANIAWKLDRADRYENTRLSRLMVDTTDALTEVSQDEIDETADLSSFDPSAEGERLRRYQFSLHRELHRAVKALTKNPPRGSETVRDTATSPVRETENGANKPNLQNGANKPNPTVAASEAPCRASSPAPATPNAPNKPNLENGANKAIPATPSIATQARNELPGQSAEDRSKVQKIQSTSSRTTTPNKAEFIRYFQGNADSWGPKSLDLLQDRSPLDALSTPGHRISCEPR